MLCSTSSSSEVSLGATTSSNKSRKRSMLKASASCDPIIMCTSSAPQAGVPGSSFNYCLCRSKAVSDGAISFYLDHFVRTRVSKFAYGQFCTLRFNPMDPEHRCRMNETFTAYSGERRIRGYFDIILAKVGSWRAGR